MDPHLDDPHLIAYLDGQLDDDADYARIERALAADPALQARLQALVESADQLKGAFRPVLQAPVPPHLIEAIWHAPWPPAPPAASVRRRRWHEWGGWSGWTPPWPVALLASAVWGAVAVGVWSATQGGGDSGADAAWAATSQLVDDGRVLAVLQAAPSGLPVVVHHSTFEVLATFEPEPGRYCREVQETRQQGVRVDVAAVVCHRADGAWQVEFAAQQRQPDGLFQTASDAVHAAVDRHVQAFAQPEPLSDEAEAHLIRRGWTPP